MRASIMGLALTLAVAGCAHAGAERFPASTEPGQLMIYVENRQWNDIDILVSGGIGAPQFLGTVPGRTTSAFPLSMALLDGATQIRLIADVQESTRRMTSEPLQLGDGKLNAHWQLRKSGLTRLTFM